MYFDPPCPPHLCKVGDNVPRSSYGGAAHAHYLIKVTGIIVFICFPMVCSAESARGWVEVR